MVGEEIHIFSTSALVGDECSASCPGRFTRDSQWKEWWVGRRNGLGDVETNIAPTVTRTRSPQPSSPHTEQGTKIVKLHHQFFKEEIFIVT
jgi:hypothetical protein